MGCDIHLHLEIRENDKKEWRKCDIFGYNRSWSIRDYDMFSVLADVRNDDNLDHLPLRGIPKDADDDIQGKYDSGSGYWHSPNWCTTQEMEDCINYIHKENLVLSIEWIALLYAMKGYESTGEYECRAVFWFDN